MYMEILGRPPNKNLHGLIPIVCNAAIKITTRKIKMIISITYLI